MLKSTLPDIAVFIRQKLSDSNISISMILDSGDPDGQHISQVATLLKKDIQMYSAKDYFNKIPASYMFSVNNSDINFVKFENTRIFFVIFMMNIWRFQYTIGFYPAVLLC